MKKPKALLSAILTCAILASAAVPAAADTSAVEESQASVSTVQSSADGGDPSTFSWDNATVYFLLTDRFENGDTSNDGAYGRQKVVAGDSRATMHGGDFAGITKKIEEGYFDDLGVNAIWMSAPYEQTHGYIQGGSNYYHYSYHGYYALDFTEADAAFGTKEEFKTLVDTAHKHGIRIIMDIVMNHVGYCSMYDMNEYGYGSLADGWETFYANPGSNAQEYQSYMLYKEGADKWAKWWGPDWIRSGVAGYSEDGDGSALTQCLEGLPDVRTESTQPVGIPPILQTKWSKEGTLAEKTAKYGSSDTTVGYISKWLAEWVREYGVDGFRCDTAKHVQISAWKQLKDECVAALKDWKAANPDKALDDLPFWMTGEHWDHGVGKDDYYTSGAFDSMINFDCTGGGILDPGSVGGKYNDYAGAINTDDSFNVLTYMSSHDTTLARGDNYYLGSAFLMLPGGVQIFYGDETARDKVAGIEDDSFKAGHCLRSDMNWGENPDLLAHWQKVGTFRNNHIAVGGGANVTLTASSGVAFGRTYSKNGINDKIAAVIGASENTDVTLDVGDVFPEGTTLINTYDEETDTVTDGQVTFNSGAHGTILLEEGEPDPVKAVVKGGAEFETTEEITVTLEGVDTAVLTIDDIRKYTVKNGDKITIGDAAYPGDTVKVTLTFTHPVKGEVTKKFSFKKKDDGTGDSRSDNALVHINTSISNPTLYAWQGDGATATKLCGEWPGTALSTKDDDGWYLADLKTTEKYNIIVNTGGSGDVKTADTTGLQGETWVIVSGDMKAQTFIDKDKAYTAAGIDVPESDFDNLKAICKEIKLLDPAEYTEESLSAALATVAEAEKLIYQGKANADPAAVTAAYKEVLAAKAALVKRDGPIPSVDKSALKQKIDEAEKIIEAHKGEGDYMSEPLHNLMAAVDEAKAVYDNAGATQAQVDDQVKKLDAAIKAFDGDTDTSSDDTDTSSEDTNTDTSSEDTDTSSDDTDTSSDTDISIDDPDTSTDDTDIPVDPQPDTDSDDPSIIPGDVNGDKKVSLRDASLIQKYCAGLVDLSPAQLKAADLNKDGKVTILDAYMIQIEVNKKFVK